jgi:hypothetical protein
MEEYTARVFERWRTVSARGFVACASTSHASVHKNSSCFSISFDTKVSYTLCTCKKCILSMRITHCAPARSAFSRSELHTVHPQEEHSLDGMCNCRPKAVRLQWSFHSLTNCVTLDPDSLAFTKKRGGGEIKVFIRFNVTNSNDSLP